MECNSKMETGLRVTSIDKSGNFKGSDYLIYLLKDSVKTQ